MGAGLGGGGGVGVLGSVWFRGFRGGVGGGFGLFLFGWWAGVGFFILGCVFAVLGGWSRRAGASPASRAGSHELSGLMRWERVHRRHTSSPGLKKGLGLIGLRVEGWFRV
mgnify:CR=1 FL=1